jgi:hypothetical protein
MGGARQPAGAGQRLSCTGPQGELGYAASVLVIVIAISWSFGAEHVVGVDVGGLVHQPQLPVAAGVVGGLLRDYVK